MGDYAERIAALTPEKREMLLRLLDRERGDKTRPQPEFPPLRPDCERLYEPFPLSEIQQVYWTGRSGLYDLGGCGTNLYQEYELVGVDETIVARFNRALRRLIERHDMLRAVMLPDGRQRILREVPPYEAEIIDLRGQEPEVVAAALGASRAALSSRLAEIYSWPLFEFIAYLLDDRRVRWHIRLDALVFDGRSRAVLFGELLQLLESPQADLPSLGCSYRDFVLAWEKFRESEPYLKSRRYWLARLPTLPPAPALPLAQKLDPQTRPEFVNWIAEMLEPAAWRNLKEAAARRGLTPSGVLIAAFIEVLAGWSTSPRFTINLVSAFRPPMHAHIERLIGNFTTSLLLAEEGTSSSFEERAQLLHRQLTTSLEHRYFSGFMALRELNRRRGGGAEAATPVIFSSVVEYSHPQFKQYEVSMAGANLESLFKFSALFIPQILLAPAVVESDGGALFCKWQAASKVFPEGMMQEMFDQYRELLRRLSENERAWHDTGLRRPRAAGDLTEGAMHESRPAGARPSQPASAGFKQAEAEIPARDIEDRLVLLWADVLETRSVGLDDNFFELGGNSFLAVRLLEQVLQAFGVVIPVEILFDGGTIRRMADYLLGQGWPSDTTG